MVFAFQGRASTDLEVSEEDTVNLGLPLSESLFRREVRIGCRSECPRRKDGGARDGASIKFLTAACELSNTG